MMEDNSLKSVLILALGLRQYSYALCMGDTFVLLQGFVVLVFRLCVALYACVCGKGGMMRPRFDPGTLCDSRVIPPEYCLLLVLPMSEG